MLQDKHLQSHEKSTCAISNTLENIERRFQVLSAYFFKSSICTRTCCSRSRALGQDLPGVKRSVAEVASRVESLRDSVGEVSSTWYQDSWLRLHSQVFGESQGVVNTTILVIVKPAIRQGQISNITLAFWLSLY